VIDKRRDGSVPDIKRIDIADFRAAGYLEANRLFFHPLGLALEVVVEDEKAATRRGSLGFFIQGPGDVLPPA
jgi:hypothetical protein